MGASIATSDIVCQRKRKREGGRGEKERKSKNLIGEGERDPTSHLTNILTKRSCSTVSPRDDLSCSRA